MFQNHCRSCKKDVDPVLDVKADIIVCPECFTEFTNVSPYIKPQLKFFGQIKRAVKTQKAFSTKCPHCQVEAPPVVKSKDLFVCSSCGKELNLSEAFKQLVRMNIKPTP